VRRRQAAADSSLELLLDTICNTFGGILFLAMLVSLLLSQTQRRTEAAAQAAGARPALSPAEVMRLERRADDLRDEAVRCESLIDDLRKMTSRFAEPELESLLQRLMETESRNACLESRRAALLASAADAQASAARAKATAADDAKRHEESQSAAEAARRRLAAAERERSSLARSAAGLAARIESEATIETSGKAPRERNTNKREMAVMVRYGRLYQMHRYTADDRTVNLTDFVVETGGELNRARPRPNAGIDLTSPGASDRVGGMFAAFPARDWYVCLVVHADSFGEFLALKTWLVSHGYDYRVFPAAEPVVDQGTGPGDARVQ
jgi:hypothetical protein